MNRPSSTITAATLTGMGVALIWELVGTFTAINPSPGLISASTVFFSSLVGYFKREKVLKPEDLG